MSFRSLVATLSVSAVALASTGALANRLPAEALKQGIANLDLASPAPRHFTVHLTTKDAATVAHVRAYFESFGFKTSYLGAADAVRLVGTLAQAQAAGHFNYKLQHMGENRSIGRLSARPHFSPSIDAVVSSTTFGGIGLKGKAQNRRMAPLDIPTNETLTGYTPAQIASFYDLNPIAEKGIDGTGQTVYLFNCGYIQPSDAEFFDSTYSLPNTTDTNFLTQVPVDGGPYYSFGGNTYTYYGAEPTLDVERVHSTAPGAAVRNYSISPFCYLNEWVDILDQITADVTTAGKPGAGVSISYGLPEGVFSYYGDAPGGPNDLLTAESESMAKVLATGTPIFAASGDSGSFYYYFFDNTIEADVLYPASDPSVISVGGTTLIVNKAGVRSKEWAWSGSGSGSGGGVSSLFPEPGYQKSVAGTLTGGKNLPDISLNADPYTGYAFAYFGGISAIGGTSASSPTWAGFMALVEEGRSKASKQPLTKVVNKLYNHAADFTDITAGVNGFYKAGIGYDHVTGIGVPDFFALYKDLKALP
jgi:subtilase family serine protease